MRLVQGDGERGSRFSGFVYQWTCLILSFVFWRVVRIARKRDVSICASVIITVNGHFKLGEGSLFGRPD